ncbi:MAG: 4Fe-4S dicluster domain-containing protein [Firmicutes bacterium]|nr:4Fe-4S dicluster domain-containing protein [Bacillota bacterium]
MMKKSILYDASKCTACRACQVACKQWNQLPAIKTSFQGSYENPPEFSAKTWTKIAFREHLDEGSERVKWLFSKQGCMHCTDAACVKVCPANAIYHTEFGTVKIDQDKCIGCNYCIANCTYNVIGFDQEANVARKCTFCYDRITTGLKPACVTTCPTGALTYGSRSEMIALANERLSYLQEKGNPDANIYGLEELDGLSMLYVLEDRPEKYGLLENPRVSTRANIWNIIFKPVRALVVLAMFFALWVNKGESKKQSGDSTTA